MVGGKDHGDEGEGGGEGGHDDGVEAVDGALHYDVAHGLSGLVAEGLVFGYQEDAVAGGDAEEGDESDDGGDAQDARPQAHGQHATDECQGQVEEHDER